jgi:hypothetical protein
LNRDPHEPGEPNKTPPVNLTAGAGALSEQDRAAVVAAVLALEPMSDEQINAVCEVITTSRVRWNTNKAA